MSCAISNQPREHLISVSCVLWRVRTRRVTPPAGISGSLFPAWGSRGLEQSSLAPFHSPRISAAPPIRGSARGIAHVMTSRASESAMESCLDPVRPVHHSDSNDLVARVSCADTRELASLPSARKTGCQDCADYGIVRVSVASGLALLDDSRLP